MKNLPQMSHESLSKRPKWLARGVSFQLALIGTLLITALSFVSPPGIPNSDDLLRLVTVRDLLAGQSWFDLTQYRLGLDQGTLMHWSRLVDAPIAAIVKMTVFLTGNELLGEKIAQLIWPMVTLFLALLAVNIACIRLKRPPMRGPATIVATAALLTIGVFGTGFLDHHNIQIALALWLMTCLILGEKPVRYHRAAGVIAVMMLAIGMEVMPYVAVACAWVTVNFLFGRLNSGAASAFGTALATASLAVFFATVGPAHYFNVYFDAFSIYHVTLCVVGGFGLAIIAERAHSSGAKLFALGLLTIIIALILFYIFPEFIINPLSKLDPRLRAFWLDGVIETRSIFDLWQSDPFALLGIFGLASFGFLAALHIAVFNKGDIRQFAALSLVMLISAIAVTAWQQRGMLFAAPFAILPLSYVLTTLRARYHETRSHLALIGMVSFGILSLNIFWWLLGANLAHYFLNAPTLQEQAASASPRDYCYGADVYDALSKEKTGVVLGATDIGANILLYTDHRALAGPYHRNMAGNLAMIDAMTASPLRAKSIVQRAGVTLIADCINSADSVDFIEARPIGLQAKLRQGAAPYWLEKIESTANDPLVLYRVKLDE